MALVLVLVPVTAMMPIAIVAVVVIIAVIRPRVLGSILRERAAAVAVPPLIAVLLSGCQDPTLSKKSASPYLLVEKGPYQSLYGPDGKIERLVYDQNGDGVADAVILYGPDGKIRLAEIDTDFDKVV